MSKRLIGWLFMEAISRSVDVESRQNRIKDGESRKSDGLLRGTPKWKCRKIKIVK